MERLQVREQSGEHFENLDLSAVSLRSFHFEDCSFSHCHFSGADLTGATFFSCRFESCDLSNALFQGARFRMPSFQDCKMLGLQWVHLTDFVAPRFERCRLDFSNFSSLKLKKSEFLSCSLREVDFTQADLSETCFKESELLGTQFLNTNLAKADFRQAFHYSINPLNNKIKGARFSLPEACSLLEGLGIVID